MQSKVSHKSKASVIKPTTKEQERQIDLVKQHPLFYHVTHVSWSQEPTSDHQHMAKDCEGHGC